MSVFNSFMTMEAPWQQFNQQRNQNWTSCHSL